MEPLSILLGYDKNMVGKIYNEDIKATDEFENKIDMILKQPKFIIELLQKHKDKITKESLREKVENIIKKYGISKKDLSKVLGCAQITILRYSHDKNPINKEKQYYEKLKQIRCDSK